MSNELPQNAFLGFNATKTRRLLELVDGLGIRHLDLKGPSFFCHNLVNCLIVDRSTSSLVDSTTRGPCWLSECCRTTRTTNNEVSLADARCEWQEYFFGSSARYKSTSLGTRKRERLPRRKISLRLPIICLRWPIILLRCLLKKSRGQLIWNP